jgi:hypothetical protein
VPAPVGSTLARQDHGHAKRVPSNHAEGQWEVVPGVVEIEAVEQTAAGTSKSAVSRRFVAATESALADLQAVGLPTLDLVAVMVDGPLARGPARSTADGRVVRGSVACLCAGRR